MWKEAGVKRRCVKRGRCGTSEMNEREMCKEGDVEREAGVDGGLSARRLSSTVQKGAM